MVPAFLHRLGQMGQTAMQRAMPVPAGMAGLLTDEDVSNARRMGLLGFGSALLDASGPGPGMAPAPGIAQALGRGIQTGLGTYQTSVGNAAQGNLQSLDLQKKMMLDAQRQQIQQKYAAMPNGPDKLKAMFNDFVQAGDLEMVGKLAQVMPSLNTGAQKALIRNDLGDRVELIDPVTGAVVRTEKKGMAPKTSEETNADRRFTADQSNKILDDFRADTKKFADVVSGWQVAEGAMKDPSLATPFGLMDAYARVTNPGAIVRPTTLEMLHNMGSLGQRIQKAWESNATGQLPPDVQKELIRTIYNIAKIHERDFKTIRAKAIERARRAKVDDLDSLLMDFDIVNPYDRQQPNGGSAQTGSGQVRQFLK